MRMQPLVTSPGGYEKAVHKMQDQGVDVNAEGGEYGTALQAASFRGYEKVVQMLLDRGADANTFMAMHSRLHHTRVMKE